MKYHKLVLPEFMNDQGALFGGYLLKWIDEFSYIQASLDYPNNRFVTVSLDSVEFRKPISLGAMLCFDINLNRLGNTSVKYNVKVYDAKAPGGTDEILFETNIIFVNVDPSGTKKKIVRPIS